MCSSFELLAHRGHGRAARRLAANLHHAAVTLEGLAHPPRVLGIERHRLFLVDVFSGLQRGHELEHVLMLRRAISTASIVLSSSTRRKSRVRFRLWHDLLRLVQPPCVEVRDGHGFDVGGFSAACESSIPLPPAPMSAKRTRSLAPSTRLLDQALLAATAAVLLTTRDMNWRRVDIVVCAAVQKTRRKPSRNCRSSIPSRARSCTPVMVMKSSPSPTSLSGMPRCGVFVKLKASRRNCSLSPEVIAELPRQPEVPVERAWRPQDVVAGVAEPRFGDLGEGVGS